MGPGKYDPTQTPHDVQTHNRSSFRYTCSHIIRYKNKQGSETQSQKHPDRENPPSTTDCKARESRTNGSLTDGGTFSRGITLTPDHHAIGFTAVEPMAEEMAPGMPTYTGGT